MRMTARSGAALGRGMASLFGGTNGAEADGQLLGAKTAQATAEAKKANAEREKIEAAARLSTDDGLLETALLDTGIPGTQAKKDYSSLLATGVKPQALSDMPDDQMGPGAPLGAPDYMSDDKVSRVQKMLSALRMTGGSASSLDDVAKYRAGEQDTGFRSDFVNPETPNTKVERLGSLLKAGDIYKTGENGARTNVYTGDINTDNQVFPVWKGVRDSEKKRNAANAEQSYASAEASRASAEEHRAGAELKRAQAKAGGFSPSRGATPSAFGNDKPMPAAVLNRQDEHIEALGTLDSSNEKLRAVYKKLKDGSLKLGPLRNVQNKAANATGTSDVESRNYHEFRTTISGLRGAVMLLHKGQQTEGDAKRAMDEILESFTDTKLVKDRIEKLISYNEQAANTRVRQINWLRRNYANEAVTLNDLMGRGGKQPPPGERAPLGSFGKKPAQAPAAKGAVDPAQFDKPS